MISWKILAKLYFKDGEKAGRLMYKNMHTKVEIIQPKMRLNKIQTFSNTKSNLFRLREQKKNKHNQCNKIFKNQILGKSYDQTYSVILINVNRLYLSMKKIFSTCLITQDSNI